VQELCNHRYKENGVPWAVEHKVRTRAKILSAASRAFRIHGWAGIGVDGLAKEAGLTSGGFYGHFISKGALFREVISLGLERLGEGIRRFQQSAKEGESWLHGFALFYLGRDHRSGVGSGCVLPSLSGEAARHGPEVRETFESGVLKVLEQVEQSGLQREEAWVLLALALGGVTLSRAVHSSRCADEIAQAVAKAISKLG
jgi:TetR/AcrR family transcriptional regulator, transcriptional repressor for nem operon